MGNNLYFIKQEGKPNLYSTHILICKKKLLRPLLRLREYYRMASEKKEKENRKKNSEVIFWAGNCSPGLKAIAIVSSGHAQDWTYRQGTSRDITPSCWIATDRLSERGSHCLHFCIHRWGHSVPWFDWWSHLSAVDHMSKHYLRSRLAKGRAQELTGMGGR